MDAPRSTQAVAFRGLLGLFAIVAGAVATGVTGLALLLLTGWQRGCDLPGGGGHIDDAAFDVGVAVGATLCWTMVAALLVVAFGAPLPRLRRWLIAPVIVAVLASAHVGWAAADRTSSPSTPDQCDRGVDMSLMLHDLAHGARALTLEDEAVR